MKTTKLLLILLIAIICTKSSFSQRYLGEAKPYSLKVSTFNSDITSILVSGVEKFVGGDARKKALKLDFDEFTYNSVIEITIRKQASDANGQQAALKALIEYKDEDNNQEKVESGAHFFCNQFSAFTYPDKGKSSDIQGAAKWISTQFNVNEITCSYRFRPKQRSKRVLIFAQAGEVIKNISFGSFKYTPSEGTKEIKLDQLIDLQKGDKFTIVSSPHVQVKLVYEDIYGIETHVTSNTFEWQCNRVAAIKGPSDATSNIEDLKSVIAISAERNKENLTCEWDYKITPKDTIRADIYAQADDHITEIRLGSFVKQFTTSGIESNKLHQYHNVSLLLEDGDIISVTSENISDQFSTQFKAVLTDSNNAQTTYLTNLTWKCNGADACKGNNETNNSEVLSDAEKIWSCNPQIKIVTCFTIYRGNANYLY